MCSSKRTFDCWDSAYQNTMTVSSYNKWLGVNTYTKACKSCGSTEYEKVTEHRQLLGNCYQRIVVCKCSNTFIEDEER